MPRHLFREAIFLSRCGVLRVSLLLLERTMNPQAAHRLSQFVAKTHAARALRATVDHEYQQRRTHIASLRSTLAEALEQESADGPLRIHDDLYVRFRTVQSQRAVSAEAMYEAVASVSQQAVDMEIARGSANGASCEPTDAWWRCVIARLRETTTASSRVLVLGDKAPRGVVPTAPPAVVGLAMALDEAQKEYDRYKRESQTACSEVEPAQTDTDYIAQLLRDREADTYVVVTTDGGSRCRYRLRPRTKRRAKTATPAHLARPDTLASIDASIRALRGCEDRPTALHVISGLLKTARQCGAQEHSDVEVVLTTEDE